MPCDTLKLGMRRNDSGGGFIAPLPDFHSKWAKRGSKEACEIASYAVPYRETSSLLVEKVWGLTAFQRPERG